MPRIPNRSQPMQIPGTPVAPEFMEMAEAFVLENLEKQIEEINEPPPKLD